MILEGRIEDAAEGANALRPLTYPSSMSRIGGLAVDATPRALLPHVERRIDRSADCWLFTGPLRPDGYARVSIKDKMTYLHIYVYTTLIGPVPDGKQLDHTCRVRHCCNPDHLEPVTQQENIARGMVGENMRIKTHCPQGHPYDDQNTYMYTHGGTRINRICRACHRERDRARRVTRLAE